MTLSATNDGSGMRQIRFSNNETTWSTPKPFFATDSWTLSAGAIRPDFAAADANADSKIGLSEVIFILQKIAGTRQNYYTGN